MNGTEYSDKVLDSLISDISAGDRSALAGLYELCSERVYAYAFSLLKNRSDAEDIMQDLMLEIWRTAPNYQSRGKPMAWLIGICKNLCKMRLRKASKTAEKPSEDYLAELSDGSMSPETKAVIRLCLNALSDGEREAVILHAVSGLRFREISELSNEPLSTVISRYQRGIKKLANELEGLFK